MQRATTFDMMVSDVLATYEQYLDAKANNKPLEPTAFNYNEDELMSMMENARGNKHNKKTGNGK